MSIICTPASIFRRRFDLLLNATWYVATGNAPMPVASQEATVPLTANPVTGAAESPYTLTFKFAGVALYREINKSRSSLLDAHAGDPFTGRDAKISAVDLDLGWGPGLDTSLMLQNKEFGVEVRYLELA